MFVNKDKLQFLSSVGIKYQEGCLIDEIYIFCFQFIYIFVCLSAWTEMSVDPVLEHTRAQVIAVIREVRFCFISILSFLD